MSTKTIMAYIWVPKLENSSLKPYWFYFRIEGRDKKK
jgi:hypothetical protein